MQPEVLLRVLSYKTLENFDMALGQGFNRIVIFYFHLLEQDLKLRGTGTDHSTNKHGCVEF